MASVNPPQLRQSDQARLEASEARYRRLFETAQDAILILDDQGKVMDANPFVVDMLGYSCEELSGKALWEIGLFGDMSESKAAMEQLQRAGYIRYENLPLQTKQGVRVEVEFVSNSYMVGDEKVFQCNIRDISDRKRAEAAAHIHAERFRFLAESMPLMIFTSTPAGIIDYVNHEMLAYIGPGTDADWSAGQWQFTHPDEIEQHSRLWQLSIESGEPFRHECRLRRRDGVYRWHLTRAAAMRDPDGEVRMWVGWSNDIDDRKSIEETLIRQYRESEAVSRAKDEFLATSSHELRTPLTSILGWAELLATGELDEQTQLEAVQSIRDSARAQSKLIDDMLDVSRLLTGKLELNDEPVNVEATLLLAIRAIRPLAEDKKIRLETSLDRGVPPVNGDGTRLQQIFSNILANAVKFTPGGGTIRVRLSSGDDKVIVEVSDTGKGISADFLPRAFESLTQEGGTSTREHGGLGLGLSIVKQLVQMHGGEVRGESAGPGFGSIFTVSLPPSHRVAAEAEPALDIPDLREARRTDQIGSVEGMRLLVVDDEPDVLKMIATVLRGAGATVVTASSADEAFDQLGGHPFDVLISDIAMPLTDGHSLVKRIRSRDDSKATIPAVALTAYGGPLQRQLALAAGFNEYLKKPFAPGDLIRSVSGVIPRVH